MIKEKLEIYQYQSTPNKGYQSPGPSGGGGRSIEMLLINSLIYR